MLRSVALLLPSFSAVAQGLFVVEDAVEKQLLSTYDYLVVGGGLSGLVVASRLTEDPNSSSTASKPDTACAQGVATS